MIPVSLRSPSRLALILLASAGLSFGGDVIRLKSGVKLDGVILSENANEVVIEVMLTESIKDQKTVSRKDIAEIIKATPDQFEAADLAKLIPSDDGMSDKAYQTIIDTRLKLFLKKYPASLYKADVEKILKTYEEEMAKAASGAKKIEGVWVLPEELQWNNYNFEARLMRVQMDKLLKQGKPEAAYRILTTLEDTKQASVETVAALEHFKAALPEFQKTMERLVADQPAKEKFRIEGAKSFSSVDKARFDEKLKQDAEDLRLLQEQDKKNKIAIPAYSEFDLKSLTEAQAGLTKEAARINKLNLAELKAGAEAFQSGLKNQHERSFLSAQSDFEKAAKAFPKNEFVKEQAELVKKAAAEALRVANETKQQQPAVTAQPAPDKKDDKGKAKEPAKTEGGAPVKKTPAADAEPDSDSAAVVEPEPSSNMPMLLVAGAVGLLVILLVVKSLAKKKGRADDE